MDDLKVFLQILGLWFLAIVTLPFWVFLLPWVLLEWEKMKQEGRV